MTARWAVRADPARAAERGKSLLLRHNPTISTIVGLFLYPVYIFRGLLIQGKMQLFRFIGYTVGYM